MLYVQVQDIPNFILFCKVRGVVGVLGVPGPKRMCLIQGLWEIGAHYLIEIPPSFIWYPSYTIRP